MKKSEISAENKKIITAIKAENVNENIKDKWKRLKESFSSSGSIIAISYLPVTRALKIENNARNTANKPNSSGE